MDSLHAAITAYQTALDQPAMQQKDCSPSCVMGILLSRDRLALELSRGKPCGGDLDAISKLDTRLQSSAGTIDKSVGRSRLAAWRESMQPPTLAWWWKLDERAAAVEPKPHPLWAIAAGFFLTISISLSAEIARRFLSVGPDFVGVFSTLLQGLLALMAGRSLTEAGQHTMERLLSSVHVDRRQAHIANAVFALTLLLLVLGLRLSLPLIARAYNDQGVRQQQSGQVTSAIQSFLRATNLNPNYAVAYYNLGTTYEDILAYDLALTSYQTALRTDSHLYTAYNNLARLYMRQRSDFGNALALLDYALDLNLTMSADQKTIIEYALYKNRGWANLGLKYLTLAESDLRQALALRSDGASAYCLLAQVLEARGNVQAALASWESCLRYANGAEQVEAQWVAQARERLSEGTQK
jgi:tetratricopeptide (TPR) repeat protein